MSNPSSPSFVELLDKALENFGINRNENGHTPAFRGAGYAALALASAIHDPTDKEGFVRLVDSAVDQLDTDRSARNVENANTFVIRGNGFALLALATAVMEQRA